MFARCEPCVEARLAIALFRGMPAVEHVAAAGWLDAGASIVTGSEMPAEHRDAVGHKSLKEYRR
jgi:hypothetical protein